MLWLIVTTLSSLPTNALPVCLITNTVREGNPLVYGGAVSRVDGNPIAGDIVDVVDSSGKFIAWGTCLDLVI